MMISRIPILTLLPCFLRRHLSLGFGRDELEQRDVAITCVINRLVSSFSHEMAPSIDANKSPMHDLPTPEPESPLRPRNPYRFSTLCATVENPDMKDQHGSSSVPIYQSATFKGIGNQFDYSRSGNPTRSHLGALPPFIF